MAAKSNLIAVSVEFERIHPHEAGILVPLAEAAKFQEEHSGSHRMLKVHWASGGTSWGKLWFFGGTRVVCRIGAGSHGDLTVWEHPVCPYDRKARLAAGIDRAAA